MRGKNFIVDNQLPRALVEFLIEQGHHAQHVMDLEMNEATDHSIWLHAQKHDLIIVSKDEDFLNLVCQAKNKVFIP